MNCYSHPQEPAAALCTDCQKGLCVECASQYSMPICTSCNTARAKSEKMKIYQEFGLMLVFGIIGYLYVDGIMASHMSRNILSTKILFIFFGAGAYAGWKTLNKITPRMFLFLPLGGWVLYFIIKLLASIVIGMIALPIWIFKNLMRLKELKNLS